MDPEGDYLHCISLDNLRLVLLNIRKTVKCGLLLSVASIYVFLRFRLLSVSVFGIQGCSLCCKELLNFGGVVARFWP